MTANEQKEWDLKLRKIDAEILELQSRANKLVSETGMINIETSYYVLFRGIALGAGLLAAGAAFTKAFL